jgi:sulfite exporter TauE/SafE
MVLDLSWMMVSIQTSYIDMGVFFLIGLLGGAHCIGMCGPLVTTYSERLETSVAADGGTLPWYEMRQHALFNAGRTVSYAMLGGLFGLLGAFVYGIATVVTVTTAIRAVGGIIAGTVIISIGLFRVFGRQQSLFSWLPLGGAIGAAFSRSYAAITSHIDRWVNGPGIAGLGALHGLLPCPLLYPAFLYAFVHGSPISGMLNLAALGIGTLPTMFLYGTVIQSVDPAHRAIVYRTLGVAFIVLGYIPLAHGLALLGLPVPMVKPPIYQPLGGVGGHGHGLISGGGL